MSNDLKPTIQDVIYCLKAARGEERCSKCRFYGSLYNAECQKVDEIKLEALEKQVAKKPLHSIYYPNGRKLHHIYCGKCGMYRQKVYKRDNYCRNCGTKIDWSELDE